MPTRQTISIVAVNFKIASLYLLFKDILNYNTENFVIQKEDLIMAGYKVEICGVNTSKLPMLKDEEKDELFVLIKNGDMEARDKYIKGNLRFSPSSSVSQITMKTQMICFRLAASV